MHALMTARMLSDIEFVKSDFNNIYRYLSLGSAKR